MTTADSTTAELTTAEWYEDRGGWIAVRLRVTPKASQALIGPVVEAAGGGRRLKVAVTAAPEGGKANAAVVALLAKALGAPKSALRVVGGETSRSKTLSLDPAYRAGLAALAEGRRR